MKATLFHRSAQMSDEDLMGASILCPFCGFANRKRVELIQEEPKVALLNCDNCWASSASRMPTSEALKNYYSSYYLDKAERITLDGPDRMAGHIYKYATPFLVNISGRDISILDYGGGDGSISILLSEKLLKGGAKKVNITLIDYDTSPVTSSNDRINILRLDSLESIKGQSIDLAIASAVIEHVPQPRLVLERLFHSLKVGGVFYARTPYVTPFLKMSKVLGLNFDFTYPAHVHDLGAKFWGNILKVFSLEGNYSIIKTNPSIVETSLDRNFFRTLVAYVLKIPGYLFKESYGLVGGWEIFIGRIS